MIPTKLLQKLGIYGTCKYCGGVTEIDMDRLKAGYSMREICKECGEKI